MYSHEKTWSYWDKELHQSEDQMKRMKRACEFVYKPIDIDKNQGTAHFQGDDTIYLTTLDSCTCKDYKNRQLPCKHIYRLAYELNVISMKVEAVNPNSFLSLLKNIPNYLPGFRSRSKIKMVIAIIYYLCAFVVPDGFILKYIFIILPIVLLNIKKISSVPNTPSVEKPKPILTSVSINTSNTNAIPKTKLLYKKRHIFMDEFVCFDVETTGLDHSKDKIVQIALVHFKDNEILNTYSTFINPQIKIPKEASRIHGITNDKVKNAPVIKDILNDIVEFVGSKTIVAHNASFDMKFLLAAMYHCNYEHKTFYVSDTLSLSRKYIYSSNYKLETLVETLRLPVSKSHDALEDAKACGYLYLECKKEMYMQNVPKRLKTAREYEKEDKYDLAIQIYEDVICNEFDGNGPYDRLAIIYRKLKRYEDEIRVLLKAIDVFTNKVSKDRSDRLPKLEKFELRLEKAKALMEKQELVG